MRSQFSGLKSVVAAGLFLLSGSAFALAVPADLSIQGSIDATATPLVNTGDGIDWSVGDFRENPAGDGNATQSFADNLAFDIEMTNNSATESYEITIRFLFEHSVETDGSSPLHGPSVAESVINVANGTASPRIVSSSGTSADNDSNPPGLDVNFLVGPGATAHFDGTHTWSGTANGSTGFAEVQAEVSLTLTDIGLVSTSPTPTIPEPQTLLLIGLGLSGLIATRRRRSSTR